MWHPSCSVEASASLALPPMRAFQKHEEDGKSDVQLETKSDGGGSWLLLSGRCFRPKEGRTSAEAAKHGGGYPKRRKAPLEQQQQSGRQKKRRQKGKKLETRLVECPPVSHEVANPKPTHREMARVSFCSQSRAFYEQAIEIESGFLFQ